MTTALDGLTVLIPEGCELDLFAAMLEAKGAVAWRCPLVSILDLADIAEAEAWIEQIAAGTFQDVVWLTGDLARMMRSAGPSTACAHTGFDMCRKPGRAEFIPIRLRQRGAIIWAERTGSDGSGRLAPLLEATGFAFLSTGMGAIRHGDEIEVIPFEPGVIASRRETVHG